MGELLLLSYDLQFFAKEGPGGEKTEDATAKKREDTRKEGRVAKSKELTSAFELLALFVLLKVFMEYLGTSFREVLFMMYNKMPDFVADSVGGFSIKSLDYLLKNVLIRIVLIMLPVLIGGMVVSFVISLVQVKWKVTTEPLKPKLSKFNPLNGFKRIFSKDSIFELIKAFLKLAVIVYVAYTCLKDNANVIFILYEIPLTQAIGLFGNIALNMGIRISIVYLIIGIVDYVYQKRKFNEDIKMTKQEVKDEYKNTEGNPEIKQAQNRRMREASRRRMMSDVPKADVIITNPTHLAVAIRYEAGVDDAPIVLAKGEDFLARKIKEVARENDIEIVENKPLARALYANVDVGAPIPQELYQAVAEVLAYVYKLKDKIS